MRRSLSRVRPPRAFRHLHPDGPQGLSYLSVGWTRSLNVCYQLMETDNPGCWGVDVGPRKGRGAASTIVGLVGLILGEGSVRHLR